MNENIDQILSDFRDWLGELSTLPEIPAENNNTVDLFTLTAQFTALRHEVNLQTKAARNSIDQNGELAAKLSEALNLLKTQSEGETDSSINSMLKILIDLYDNLALALKQVVKQRDQVEAPLSQLIATIELPPLPALPSISGQNQPQPGFLARLFGARPIAMDTTAFATWHAETSKILESRRENVVAIGNQIRESLESLISGYKMSMNRIDRALEKYELEPIACNGIGFDPELMEAVEVVSEANASSGTVLEDVRRGYRRNGSIFRFAQVRVAR